MSTDGHGLCAGAAVADITPRDSQFLWGYPHVRRYSTGVHDPLSSSAICLRDATTEMLLIANDVAFISKATADRVRQRISAATGTPVEHILVSATHTHSGPVTADLVSNSLDTAVPRVDPGYLQLLEDGICSAGIEACRVAEPARLGMATTYVRGIGGHRRDAAGPADFQVPVMVVRSADGAKVLGAMLVCCMHPTVLDEDSTLISGDFPAMARRYLQRHVLGIDCPVLHHTGPCGNQSPRRVTQGNTFAEAERLGELLGRGVAQVVPSIAYAREVKLAVRHSLVELPRRTIISAAEARRRLDEAAVRFQRLQADTTAGRADVQTAERNWFGAEETLALARAAADGRLEAVAAGCLPAEIQVFGIGPWRFVAWPGELFVEYGLALKGACPDTFAISLANGELQGYIVTPEAAQEGGYEASNAVFAPDSGRLLVEQALRLIAEL